MPTITPSISLPVAQLNMEDEEKTSHPSPATCPNPEPANSDSGDDPHPPPPTTTNAGEEAKERDPEDQETVRESKRRKICPSVLEKCEAILINSCSNNSNCFSFSFDPKFSSGVSTPEVTPKFGSFNLEAASAATAGISTEFEEKASGEKGEEEEEGEKDDEVKEKTNILEVLDSVDGLSAD